MPPEQIVAIGIDFTACTVLPTKSDGTPLCFLKEYECEPHAYVKLWKHHAAQYCAEIINKKAVERNESFLKRFGGKISSEFYFPKLLQIALEAPQIFENADLFIEAADWLTWKLTGKLCRSASFAGYKAMWDKKEGYPSKDFLDSLKDGFGEKSYSLLKGDILMPCTIAGYISNEFASLTGLTTKTAVITPIIDAHSALFSAGIHKKDEMLIIMGTSGCHVSLSDTYKEIPGILASVQDGILPDFFGYESGQSGFGDHFEWLSNNFVPESLSKQAREKDTNVLELLAEKAKQQKPGEHGLIALDWFNGNRSPLNDSDLSGLILGLNLNTKPEDIYRALVEAIAYGSRKIIENYEKHDFSINSVCACGSLSKNDFIMQIFADVLGKEIKIADSENGSALGSAIIAASASGELALDDAITKLCKLRTSSYKPIPENQEIFDKLYSEYSKLYNYFGCGENNVMKELNKYKK